MKQTLNGLTVNEARYDRESASLEFSITVQPERAWGATLGGYIGYNGTDKHLRINTINGVEVDDLAVVFAWLYRFQSRILDMIKDEADGKS